MNLRRVYCALIKVNTIKAIDDSLEITIIELT